MRRVLLRSSAFMRAARRMVRRKPELAQAVGEALALLAEDAHQPALRTHKLTGDLRDSWACSAGYDLRIVFSFVRHDGAEAILLETIGTHDEVY